MRFRNHTPFPAFLHREAIHGDRMAAAAILRATFDIGSGRPTRDQPWLVMPSPWEGPAGVMEPDAVFDREGCDLLLLGEASPPDGSEVESLDVSLVVGDFHGSVRVFGDRVWVRGAEALVPSSPTPFTRMPLDLKHAFGGVGTYDGLEVPCTDNPQGKGFYLEETEAEGKALPNIEAPDALIRGWDDKPEPVGVGFCPIGFPPRFRRGAVIRNNEVVRLTRAINNVAFPRFIAPSVAAGAAVALKGMGPDLVFSLPTTEVIAVTRIGNVEHRDVARIDQLGIEPGRRRLFITYRFTFIYPLRPGDVRRCELRWPMSTTDGLTPAVSEAS